MEGYINIFTDIDGLTLEKACKCLWLPNARASTHIKTLLMRPYCAKDSARHGIIDVLSSSWRPLSEGRFANDVIIRQLHLGRDCHPFFLFVSPFPCGAAAVTPCCSKPNHLLLYYTILYLLN